MENRSQATLHLARDLVDDVELSRVVPEAMLLKALRLARLVDDRSTQQWLRFELDGYPNTEDARIWMRRLGRFTDEKSNFGYWIPLAGISGMIAAMQTEIQTLKIPNINYAPSSANPNEFVSGFGMTVDRIIAPANSVLDRLQFITTAIGTLSSIRSRVLTGVHDFAVGKYHTLAFEGLAEGIFERHKLDLDRLLASEVPDVLEKLPAIYERLADGEAEAVSQAMNSLRRMIKSIADQLFPSSDAIVQRDGQTYEVGSDKVLNRLKLCLIDRCASKSRRDRLQRAIRDIHERASVGSHSEITPSEAKALFLACYLTLGEIVECAGISGQNPNNNDPDPELGSHGKGKGA